VFFIIFVVVGLVVFLGVEIFKKFNSVELMILEVEDITDFLCTIDVFGDNSIYSPLKIIENFDNEFIEVSD
jgi:hypothetical protein